MRGLLTLMVIVGLTGCGFVRSSHTAFHTLNSGYKSKDIAVVPGNNELSNSLQFATFKSKLELKLRQSGFRISQDPSSTSLLAYLNYGIDGGTTTTHTGSTPIYGQTGGGTTFHSGTANAYGTRGSAYGTYSGSSYTMPTYGVVGSQAYSFNRTTYKRVLAVDILDREQLKAGKPKKIYEVKLTSSGSCSQIAGVFDALLEALFKDFPGESGRSQRTTIDWDSSKC